MKRNEKFVQSPNMKKKKYYKEDIIEAILDKFGSIDEYAKYLGTSRQNIYGKIDRQSRNFMKSLKDSGVLVNNGLQIGESNITDNKGEVNIGTENYKLLSELEKLQAENKMLKEIIKGKDEIIGLLKKQTN